MTRLSEFRILLLFFLLACNEHNPTRLHTNNTVNQMAKRKIADPDYSSSHVDNLQKSQVSEKKKEHRFHIIVASCNRRSQAEMVKSKLNQNNKNSAIVLESNGKFRVSLQSFTNKTLAEEELNRQRKRLKKPEIWLLAE